MIFDARTATQESESSPIHPDNIDYDKEYPGYWPERRHSTQPPPNSPPVATISDAQLADWTRSQLPWYTFRHRIPELWDIPDALCRPPHIPRLYPSHQHGTPDQLGVYDRTSHFYNAPNNQTWTQYLASLPPIVRRYYNTLPPSRYDCPLHTFTSTKPRATRLGGYSRSTDPTSHQTVPRKRQRTTPPTSDSDPEGYSRNNQPYDAPRLRQPTSIPPPSNIADSKRSSEEAHYGRSNSGTRPRFAHEDKLTPHLRLCLNARAANRRMATVRDWYHAHKGPVNPSDTPATATPSDLPNPTKNQSSSKDPTQPHPDDLPTPNPSSLTPPAEQCSLTTVNNLGGYTSCVPSPAPPPCLPETRPSLTSIHLKNHRAENPTPQHQTPRPGPRSQSAQTHRSTIQNSTPSAPLEHRSPIHNYRNTATCFNPFSPSHPSTVHISPATSRYGGPTMVRRMHRPTQRR